MGGCTIAEAQERLGMSEFLDWVAYRRKRGSLNWGMRVEHGSALLATLYSNAHLPKGEPRRRLTDFMDHKDEPPPSLEQAMEDWK